MAKRSRSRRVKRITDPAYLKLSHDWIAQGADEVEVAQTLGSDITSFFDE